MRYIVKVFKRRRIAIYRKTGQTKGINRERIIRVLLNNPEGLSKYRVSKLSSTSFSWTHKYLGKLEVEGYVKGTRVVRYRELVYHWLKIHAQPRRRDFLIQDPFEFLKNTDMTYALTTYAAENLTQRHLFLSRYDVYIRREDEEAWSRRLSSMGLMGRGNFRILIDDEHVFYNTRKANGFSTVCLPQLILDLLVEGGVCGEAADMLLDKVEGKYV